MDFNVENYLSSLSYINKDFQSIWDELLETVPKLTTKWLPSEANESDPLVVLLKELAIIADKLNYNIDKNVLELFPATLTQLRSAYNVYDSLGYAPDWYVSATTSVSIIYNGLLSGSVPSTENAGTTFTIKKFQQVSDDDSEIIYTLLGDVAGENGAPITIGTPATYTVTAIEGTLNDFTVNGSTRITYSNLDAQNRLYFNETNIAQNGIIISEHSDFSDFNVNELIGNSSVNNSDDSNYWRRVTNLNQYVAGQRIYKLGIDSATNAVYIQFPDDIGNLMGNGLYIKYILSSGESGNIGRGDLTKFANVTSFPVINSLGAELTVSATDDFTITNTRSAQNGSDPLDIEEMRTQFNRVVGTFETLVTLRDYENFLTNYTDSIGNHVVSNVRVSDRFHDPFDTIIYKTLSSDGVISDVTTTVTWTTGDDVETHLSAYDLRLYPFRAPQNDNYSSESDFNYSFNVNMSSHQMGELTEEITGSSVMSESDVPINITNTDYVLAESKCISHNFRNSRQPIIIPYAMDGQLYLQAPVTGTEATKILQSVESTLYSTLNPSVLSWGEMIDYGAVVENIKNADNRIQYVALNSIVYENPIFAGENDGDSMGSNDNPPIDHGYDVTERTILRGNKAWTEYSPFYYTYNQIDCQWYGNNSGGNDDSGTGNSTPITSISTSITMGSSGDVSSFNSYVVGSNETVTVLIPQYNTVTSYSNYLYFIARGTSSTTLLANTPNLIPTNCQILVFSTRDAAEAYVTNSGSRNASVEYVLNEGTIIQSTVDISFVPSPTESDIQNMGSSVTISVLERATGTLRASESVTSTSGTYMIYLATNSLQLQSAFGIGESYTLLADEYLFYTDSLGLELGIVGEGTTLVPGGVVSNLFLLADEKDTQSLLNGGTFTSYYSTWTQVLSGSISYELNDLYTFGENYIIRCGNFVVSGDEETITWQNFISNTTQSNEFFVLNSVNLIQYSLADTNSDGDLIVGEGGEISCGTWTDLPAILGGGTSGSDRYQMLIRLSLIVGPSTPQSLSNIIRYTFTDDNSDKFTSPARTQNLSITAGEQVTILSNKTIQSSNIFAYQGGPSYSLTDSERNDFNLYAYVDSGNSNIPISSSGFISIQAVDNEITSISTPSNTYSVIAYILQGSSIINYAIVKGGVSIEISRDDESGEATASIPIDSSTSISGITTISIPYVVMNGASYYNGDNGEYEEVSSIVGANNAATMTSSQLYYTNFCPLYIPSEDELIENPELPESYFNKSHPYNGFCMPYLSSMNISISAQSMSR